MKMAQLGSVRRGKDAPRELERRNSTGSSRAGDKWVCPNDRHLALRAKLRMGWCTGQSNATKQDALSSEETAAILDVIKRAEQLEVNEHQRIGRLVNKVTTMREGARGDGTSSCILCGESLPLLKSATLCKDCKKGVCSKCGQEMVSGHEKVWLCKICSETREMWKRSGAWFYRGLPQNLLSTSTGLSKHRPGKGAQLGSSPSIPQQANGDRAPPRRAHSLLSADLSSMIGFGDTETDSSEDELMRRQKRGAERRSNNTSPSRSRSVSPAASSVSASTASSSRTKVVAAGKGDRHTLTTATASNGSNSSTSFSTIFGGNEGLTSPDHAPSDGWKAVNGGTRVVHVQAKGERKLSSDSCDQTLSIDLPSLPGDNLSPNLRKGMCPDSSKDSVSLFSEDGMNSLPPHFPTSPFMSSPLSGNKKNIDSEAMAIPHTASGVRKRVSIGSAVSRDSSDTIESSILGSSVDEVFDGDPRLHLAPDNWSVVSSSCGSQVGAANGTRERCSSVASSVASSNISVSSKKSAKKHRKVDDYLGYIEFTLFYDNHHQSLHCTLHHCQDLKAVSSGGSADPYVKMHLLPGASKSNKLRSKTINKTLSPEFNETLSYHGISEEDMGKKTIRMLVLDDDRFGKHFLGEARVSLKKVKGHESRRLRVQLQPKMSKSDEGSISELGLGKILLSLRYTSVRNCLVVGIVRCAHLPSRDANGFSDPYVKVQLKPDKQKKKLKTAVKWKNLNPEFHEEFSFEVKRNELPKKQLDVRVYDKDVGKTDDFIGGLVLSHDSKGPELRHWYDVIQYPDRRHDRWHSLRPMHSC